MVKGYKHKEGVDYTKMFTSDQMEFCLMVHCLCHEHENYAEEP
jgi:hypothetical protein